MQGANRFSKSVSNILARFALCFVAALGTATSARAAGLTFEAPFYVKNGGYVTNRIINTVTGPADGQRLFTGIRLVPSGEDGVYIGMDWTTVIRVNADGTTTNESSGLDSNDWAMSVAYDSQARRVVLVTLGGEGGLYQRAAETGQWSLLASMENEDLESLVYRPEDNSFYGLRLGYGEEAPLTLIRYSASGERLGEMTLPPLGVGIWIGSHRSQLFAVDGKIV